MTDTPARRRTSRAVALVVGLLVLLAVSHSAAAQWGNDFTNPKRELLRPNELERLVERVDLDADQCAILTTLVDEYRSAHRERIERMGEIAGFDGRVDGRELLGDELRRKSFENWRELLAIAAADYEARKQLKTDLQLIVREEQLPEWECFWRDHRRWTLRPQIAHYYEARVDLVAWWDSFDESIARNDKIDQLLDQYANEVDPLIQAYFSCHRESLQNHFNEQTARLAGTWRDPLQEIMFSEEALSLPKEEFEALNARVFAVGTKRRIEQLEPVREAERRIRDCNRKYIGLLASLLPPELAQDVHRRYLAEAYIWLFHNPDRGYRYHGHAFFEDVLALSDLDGGLRASIEDIRSSYERRFDAIALEVIRIAQDSEDDWKKYMRDATPYGASQESVRIQGKLNELFNSRRELQETTNATVRALLTPEQKAQIPPEEKRKRTIW